MKKVLILGICLVLIMSMLSGCMCIPSRVPKEYQCKVTMYVNNRDISIGGATTSIRASDLATSQSLIETYGAIIQSSKVRNEVIAQSGVTSEFTVEVSPLEETEVLEIIVKAENPQDAYDLACAYADVAPHIISEIVEGSSSKIIDLPVFPKEPASYQWKFGN